MSVRPSVHPSVSQSVCNAVHCGSSGRLKVKSWASVFLAGKFLFVRSDTRKLYMRAELLVTFIITLMGLI